MPLWPIDMPPAATTGQACQGASTGEVATATWSVGATQLMSATSVEPPSSSCPSSGLTPSNMPTSGTPVALWTCFANDCSSFVYLTGPSSSRFACSRRAPVSLTSISHEPPSTVTLPVVSVIVAAPSATLRVRASNCSTSSRFQSRSHNETCAYAGTTFGTSPPDTIT